MENLQLNIDKVYDFVSRDEIYSKKEKAEKCNLDLHQKTGRGSDFLGWVDLPSAINDNDIAGIRQLADSLKSKIDFMVVIGIGGSYLGARAVYEALSHSFAGLKGKGEFPQLLFAGQNIGEDYMVELLDVLETKNYGITVISKSGTTTEPALAFQNT